MKRVILLITLLALIAGNSLLAQADKKRDIPVQYQKFEKIGIVIYSNDPETVWNAFRLAIYSQGEGDTVSVFLLGKGVEVTDIKDANFNVEEKITGFLDEGGKILACGTCLNSRKSTGKGNLCTVSSLADLYAIIKKSDKILTF